MIATGERQEAPAELESLSGLKLVGIITMMRA
jgi:hypothetical protein